MPCSALDGKGSAEIVETDVAGTVLAGKHPDCKKEQEHRHAEPAGQRTDQNACHDQTGRDQKCYEKTVFHRILLSGH